MAKYKCNNKNCDLYEQLITVEKSRITIVNGTALDRNDWCPSCGEKRELIRKPGMTSVILGTNDQIKRNIREGHGI